MHTERLPDVILGASTDSQRFLCEILESFAKFWEI
jgi:hypothetical protein